MLNRVTATLGNNWMRVGSSAVIRRFADVAQLIWIRNSRADSTIQIVLSLSCPKYGIGGELVKNIRLSGLSADISVRGLGRERWWSQSELTEDGKFEQSLRVLLPFLEWASGAAAVRFLVAEKNLAVLSEAHVRGEPDEDALGCRASSTTFKQLVEGLGPSFAKRGFGLYRSERQSAFTKDRGRWIDVIEFRRDEFGATYVVSYFVMAREVWKARKELAGLLVQLNGGFVRSQTYLECFGVGSLLNGNDLYDHLDEIVRQAEDHYRRINSADSFLNSIEFGWSGVLLQPLKRLLTD